MKTKFFNTKVEIDSGSKMESCESGVVYEKGEIDR
jgi:hypothetical protein